MTIGGNWKDLLKASGEGNLPLVEYHLRQGVDPNFQHPEYFTCPIFEATRNGHLDIVKILVEQGKANPNVVEDLTDDTPIEAALEARHYVIVDYLNEQLPQENRHKFQNVLVTGGNRGIGKAICESLLKKGHRVVFTCRSQQAGETTLGDLKKTTNNHKVDYIIGDLSSIHSTLNLAALIQANFPLMNVLIHNAGAWPIEKQLNVDGLEMSFCVNYLAPYILTRELGPLLDNGLDSRIIFISGAYVFGNPDIGKTPFGNDFSPLKTYMHTKQCGIILFLNTARHFQRTNVRVNAVYPGAIQTGLGASERSWPCTRFIMGIMKQLLLYRDPSDGAVGPVWLAESQEAISSHGKYYDCLQVDNIAESVQDPAVQKDWEQWTLDFLAAE